MAAIRSGKKLRSAKDAPARAPPPSKPKVANPHEDLMAAIRLRRRKSSLGGAEPMRPKGPPPPPAPPTAKPAAKPAAEAAPPRAAPPPKPARRRRASSGVFANGRRKTVSFN